ncbi:hypothetical protein B5C06_01040 [Staphylococcus delphini]|nr:hypothetical protein B5C06_01040 [Staphylococcus delphini]
MKQTNITENEDNITDTMATMLSQYNVSVLSFHHKERLIQRFSNIYKVHHRILFIFTIFDKSVFHHTDIISFGKIKSKHHNVCF